MKRYTQMSEDEKWAYTIKYRPWTFVLFLTTIIFSVGGASLVAFQISDPMIQHTAWMVWWTVFVYAIFALLTVWHLERKGLLSERTESFAWRILFFVGIMVCVACIAGFFWPSSSLHVRLSSVLLLGGPVTGWVYLKPLIRRANKTKTDNPRGVVSPLPGR